MAVFWSLFFAVSGDDPDGGGACGFTDHSFIAPGVPFLGVHACS
jgi:hypothetical protein